MTFEEKVIIANITEPEFTIDIIEADPIHPNLIRTMTEHEFNMLRLEILKGNVNYNSVLVGNSDGEGNYYTYNLNEYANIVEPNILRPGENRSPWKYLNDEKITNVYKDILILQIAKRKANQNNGNTH